MIDRPVKLFAVAHELAFFVGFLFALLIASLPTLLQLLGVILLTVTELWQVAALADPSEASLLVRSAAFAIPLLVLVLVIASTVLLGAVGFLLSETLGLEVQRASIADLAVAPQRSGAARMVGVAIFTAGGVAAGLLFAPFNFLTIGRPSMLLLMPFWTATFAGLLWLWCMGVYKAGQAVLGSHAGYNTPELKRRLLALGLFALTCAVWLPPLATQQLILPLLELAGVSPLTALLMILGSTGLALGGFGALALALWLAVALWRLSRPLRCPNCGYQQARGRAVGQLCARCGHRLAAWAYIDDQQPYVHALEAHSQ
jgi:MFS family permease